MLEHRPSFIDNRLRQDNKHFCENDFGMPSSHTFLVVLLSLISLELFDKNIHFMTEDMSMILNYSLMVTIAFTRVYLGVHSFMQIFIGGFLAMELYLVAEYYKNIALEHIIDPILKSDSPKKRKVLKYVTLTLLVYLLISTIIF